MRIGRYSIYYHGRLITKVWTLNKAYELIANMVKLGYEKEDFEISYVVAGLRW